MSTTQTTATRSAPRARTPGPSYDGISPFPRPSGGPKSAAGSHRVQVVLTGAIVVAPLAALVAGVWLGWGHMVKLADIVLALVLYTVTAVGVTVGFHLMVSRPIATRGMQPTEPNTSSILAFVVGRLQCGASFHGRAFCAVPGHSCARIA
jgi:hypothetical protein